MQICDCEMDTLCAEIKFFSLCFFLSLMQVSANTPSMYSQELFQLSQYLQVWSNTDLYWPSKDIKNKEYFYSVNIYNGL